VATKIPEAIKYPRGLSLYGPWSIAYGSHLTFVASEDFRQTAMVVPSHPPLAADKVTLRREARERRRKFIETLERDERDAFEQALAQTLTPLIAISRVMGGYCPLPNEISPLPAMEVAAKGGAIVAFPAFSDHQSNFRFLAGDASEPGPWACFQPPLDSPEVFPDLVLVPLVAIDSHGTRLGQGKGHYDRVLGKLREHGALLIGVGWEVQRLPGAIPRDSWDIPLDGFASPAGLEMFR
jgi:5-formyltetrahydrofolate cyclo-ligase